MQHEKKLAFLFSSENSWKITHKQLALSLSLSLPLERMNHDIKKHGQTSIEFHQRIFLSLSFCLSLPKCPLLFVSVESMNEHIKLGKLLNYRRCLKMTLLNWITTLTIRFKMLPLMVLMSHFLVWFHYLLFYFVHTSCFFRLISQYLFACRRFRNKKAIFLCLCFFFFSCWFRFFFYTFFLRPSYN